jgi:site-specific DNA-cytosine methylase
VYDIIDMSHYGVPQSRRRFSLIATRLDIEIHLPYADEKQTLLADFIGESKSLSFRGLLLHPFFLPVLYSSSCPNII